MNLKNPKTLRKCLENIHPSVAIFKNADFSYSSLQHWVTNHDVVYYTYFKAGVSCEIEQT